MTTNLGKFRDAYASMTVAVFEPLILRWVSQHGISLLANGLALRTQRAGGVPPPGPTTTIGLILNLEPPTDITSKMQGAAADQGKQPVAIPIDAAGRPLDPARLQKLDLAGLPNAVAYGDRVYPYGLATTSTEALLRTVEAKPKDVPPDLKDYAEAGGKLGVDLLGPAAPLLSVNPRLGRITSGFDLASTAAQLQASLVRAAGEWVGQPHQSLTDALRTRAC
jgi:hypothetical protein